jgi:tetratricopeptide (TPR) repeat protein
MLDPYSSCPCGSGKRFKWCCQPIHAEIDRAFRQDEQGQHDAALKIMEQVVAQNAANPEAFGRQAQLLYQNDQVEAAENALQKAFDINANYPFGQLLRGMFRYHEGEIAGALLLFRRAAEVYAPDAHEPLGQVYTMVGDCELKLNRPVAARAALQLALHYHPGEEDLRKNFDGVFGSQSQLPPSARREYTFLSPAATVGGQRRAAWDRALAGASTPRFADAVRAFEQLTGEDATDAAAWYNLGLARAWLGDNRPALEALDRYVDLEPDEARAAAAWTLGEVLRLGHGMEELADHREYSVTYQVRDPNPLFNLMQEWERDRRLIGVQASQEEGIVSALVLEKLPVLAAGPSAPPSRLAAYLLVMGPILRLRHPQKESLDRVCAEVQQRAAAGLSEGLENVIHATFSDVVLEALVFPVGITDKSLAEERIREYAARFFEETWIHRPLRALSQVPPVDAAGHRTLRKKLVGLIQFLQECAAGGVIQGYDFDRLRRRLGLLGAAPDAAGASGGAVADLSAMSAAELAALLLAELSDDQLEQAYQSAVRVDAQELAGRFAGELVRRPPQPGRPDRAPWYFLLVQQALGRGDTNEALRLLDDAERVDSEHNEGRRRSDCDLRRAQVLLKRGEADRAYEVYERLLEREPGNLRSRGSAVEAMLSARQGARALRVAEEGLSRARQQNDRDSEQYFLELVAAAKRQVG